MHFTFPQSVKETQNKLQRLKGERAEIEHQIETQEYMLNVTLSRAGFPPQKQSLADQIRAYAGGRSNVRVKVEGRRSRSGQATSTEKWA